MSGKLKDKDLPETKQSYCPKCSNQDNNFADVLHKRVKGSFRYKCYKCGHLS